MSLAEGITKITEGMTILIGTVGMMLEPSPGYYNFDFLNFLDTNVYTSCGKVVKPGESTPMPKKVHFVHEKITYTFSAVDFIDPTKFGMYKGAIAIRHKQKVILFDKNKSNIIVVNTPTSIPSATSTVIPTVIPTSIPTATTPVTSADSAFTATTPVTSAVTSAAGTDLILNVPRTSEETIRFSIGEHKVSFTPDDRIVGIFGSPYEMTRAKTAGDYGLYKFEKIKISSAAETT